MKKNVSFVKTQEELEAMAKQDHLEFYEQEKLQIFWFFPEDVYKKLLPPGMEPVFPMAIAYIANFGRPQYLYPYTEGALFILGSINGEVGCYCLSMPLDGNDQAQDLGRETFGYPKKAARVKLARRGNTVEGWIERNDVRFFEVKAEIGEFNDKELGNQLIGMKPENYTFRDCVYLMNYHHCITNENPEECMIKLDTFFQNIRIDKQTNVLTIKSMEPASVDITLRESEDDPWAELKVAKVIGAEYMRYQTFMYGSTPVIKYETPEQRKAVLPHLFARWDTAILGKYHASYKAGNFYR